MEAYVNAVPSARRFFLFGGEIGKAAIGSKPHWLERTRARNQSTWHNKK